MDYQEIGRGIIDSSIKVHRTLGPGLLESAYQACMKYELHRRGIRVETKVDQPVTYEGMRIVAGYRLDMVVENRVGSGDWPLPLTPPDMRVRIRRFAKENT
ncbi:MAG: GxxExxY protein, partial [Anaerolineales bacterium]|nr:GxxExxY protein [Anaerolineales bacterium]